MSVTVTHPCGWTGTYRTPGYARMALTRHSCTKQANLRAAVNAATQRERAIDRTPAPCTHRTPHQHGTNAAYVLDRCRCLPCAAARYDTEQTRRRNHAYGTPNVVPAAPARTHVHALRAAGLGNRTIAKAAGISNGALTKLLYGSPKPDGTRRPPSARLRADTATAILAIPLPAPHDCRPGATVPATGTTRRLRSLVALGWTIQRLADLAGIDKQPLHRALHGAPTTLARTAAAVRDLYDRIGDTPPPTPTPALAAAAARARARAAAAGWPVPAWWDPEDLDDPAATTPGPNQRRRGTPTLDLDEYAHLIRNGEHPARAATRLGVTPSAVEQAARRHGRQDILTLTRQAMAA